jgi:hypothetical protein
LPAIFSIDQLHALQWVRSTLREMPSSARGADLVEVFPLVGGMDGVVDDMVEDAFAPSSKRLFR